jgi:hypothetical protein
VALRNSIVFFDLLSPGLLKSMCENFINSFVEKCIKQIEKSKVIHYEFVYIDDDRGYKAENEPKIHGSIDFSKENMIDRLVNSNLFLEYPMNEHLNVVCCEYGDLVDFGLKEIINPEFDFDHINLNQEELFSLKYHLKKGLHTIDTSFNEGLLQYLKDGFDCGCGYVYLIEDRSHALHEVGL